MQFFLLSLCHLFFHIVYSSTNSNIYNHVQYFLAGSNIYCHIHYINGWWTSRGTILFFACFWYEIIHMISSLISSQTLNSFLPSLLSFQARQLYRMSQARLNSLGWFSSSSFWTISLWFSSPSSLPSDSSSAQIREGGQSSVVVFHKIFEIKPCQVHERANERDRSGCDISVLHLPRPRRPRRLWNYRQDWKNYSAGKLRWGIIADRIFRISQW